MIILGINSFFEHPAVALIRDGELVFAIEDERLTRIKHGKSYTPYRTYIPFDAMHAALRSQGIASRDLDGIAYSYDSRRHLRSSILGSLSGRRYSTFGEEWAAYRSAVKVPTVLASNFDVPYRYRDRICASDIAKVPYREWDHHLSHAASAFFCSGFDEALVVVSDGSGEEACTSVYVGRGAKLTRIAEMRLPDSLGLFYSFITQHIGFEPFSDEYKVMGLAAYGKPTFKREMERLVTLVPNGGYRVDAPSLRNLELLLGPRRKPETSLDGPYSDIAHSAQARLEEVLEHILSHHLRATGMNKLCLAGGVFLNCVANSRLAALKEVEDIFVQPAAHDAGTAIGAAALSWIQAGGSPQLKYDSFFLGSAYKDEEIEQALRQARARYVRLNGETAASKIADLLAAERTLAVFRGCMEFGPRALGHRSIIASPRSARTREQLNELKVREQFRPLAPIVTSEAFGDYFSGTPNRFMMMTSQVREDAFDRIPAVVHADMSARVQVVRTEDDPFLHDVLTHFANHTGTPVLINTSLNVRGLPIDESPVHALSTFYTSGLDFLLIGSFLVCRDETAPLPAGVHPEALAAEAGKHAGSLVDG
jgi:carbamoyltransferase